MQFVVAGQSSSPTVLVVQQPAPGAGRRNVVTGISAFYVLSTGAIAGGFNLILRNGPSGAPPNILFIPVRTVAANEQFEFSFNFDPPFICAVNQPTTLEFGAIAAAGGVQTANLLGYII